MKIAKLSETELEIMNSFSRDHEEARRAFKVAEDRLKCINQQIADYKESLERSHGIRSARLDDDGQNLIGYSQAEWDAAHPDAPHRTNR
jgi:hypothetical protein